MCLSFGLCVGWLLGLLPNAFVCVSVNMAVGLSVGGCVLVCVGLLPGVLIYCCC